MIKGVTVTLIGRTKTGEDDFGAAVYTESEITVDNVLIGEPSAEEVAETLNLHGKMIAYTLAIPKGDENDWHDTDVVLPEPFAGRYRTIGYPTAGIEANIPLKWNKKVKVERYG